MKTILAFSFVLVAFASCQKSAVPMPEPAVAETEKTSDAAGIVGNSISESEYWSFSPALFEFTACTTSTLRSGCGTYNAGLKAASNGSYAGTTQIEVRRCDGAAFAKRVSTVEIHADSVCGSLVASNNIKPNYQYGLVNFSIWPVTKTSFYSVVILPTGKKLYSNPITITRN